MALSRKIHWLLALGGALIGMGVAVTGLVREEAVPFSGLDHSPVLGPVMPAPIPDECRIAVSPSPECTKAWDESRRYFFGPSSAPGPDRASSPGERP